MTEEGNLGIRRIPASVPSFVIGTLALILVACGGDSNTTNTTGSGGKTSGNGGSTVKSGGATAGTGGTTTVSSGGTTAVGTGGTTTVSSGGTTASSGGKVDSGGSVSSGGAAGSGGIATGGVSSGGSSSGTGGSPTGGSSTGGTTTAASCDETELVAFPCAEGYGKTTSGGRAGKVYEVTTLGGSGAGSLGDAIKASGKRTIVFRVGGTINGNFNISSGDVTIAGQTAPGDGIEINGTLSINANNIIVRYIRVRGNGSGDVITGGHYNKNIIFDHVSASYSSDEIFSVYWIYDITIQWSIISEACSGDHKFGGIWGGERASYHHNLFAHNTDRNPRIASGAGHNDVRNNVIYNWKNETIYGGERIQTNDNKKTSGDGCWVNVVGNYLKPGPGTLTAIERHARICSPWTQRGGAANYGKWYVSDNVVVGHDDITKDNWKGVFPNDVEGGKTNDQASIPGLKLETPAEFMPIRQQTAEAAYNDVLAHGGCSLPARDAVDKRIIEEVRTGTASKGDNGFVTSVSQTDGHPPLKSGTAPTDSDHDGMPDEWETANGLDPKNPEDGNKTYGPGYTMLEKYMNSLDSF